MVQIYVFIDFNCLFCLLLFALSVLFFKHHKVSNLFFFPFGIIYLLFGCLCYCCLNNLHILGFFNISIRYVLYEKVV